MSCRKSAVLKRLWGVTWYVKDQRARIFNFQLFFIVALCSLASFSPTVDLMDLSGFICEGNEESGTLFHLIRHFAAAWFQYQTGKKRMLLMLLRSTAFRNYIIVIIISFYCSLFILFSFFNIFYLIIFLFWI